METKNNKDVREDTLLGKIVQLKRDKKRLETSLLREKEKSKQMKTEQKSMMSEVQTLRAKIADLNALVSELKGTIEEQEQTQKQIVTVYKQQTDKVRAERTKYMKLAKQYKEAFETENNEVRKGNTMLEKAWKERDQYKEELHKRGKNIIDIDSLFKKIEEEEANRKRWEVSLREALRFRLTQKKILLKLIQEMKIGDENK